jgi:predicted PurR-regulated permease PerM
MQDDDRQARLPASGQLMDAMIRIGIVVALVYVCIQILAPFATLVLWAMILAVAMYPLHQGLARRLGGKQGRASTLLVLAALLLVGVPTVMLAASFADHIKDGYEAFEAGTLSLKPPGPGVEEWPVVGEKVYAAWSAAAENLPAFLKEYESQLRDTAKRLFSAAANTAVSIMLFLVSVIVAGVLMAYGAGGGQVTERILVRASGAERGPALRKLAVATVRSVAVGVLGVAFIQALILGVGFIFAGIPAAGVLAVLVLLLGIAQLPAVVITLPAIIYLWSAGDGSTAFNAIWTVYLVVGGLADGVLKPLLLGRGVEAPMLVVLLGALGGMVWGGFMGLFVGAVLLAVGYQLFMGWVETGDPAAAGESGQVGTPGQG